MGSWWGGGTTWLEHNMRLGDLFLKCFKAKSRVNEGEDVQNTRRTCRHVKTSLNAQTSTEPKSSAANMDGREL